MLPREGYMEGHRRMPGWDVGARPTVRMPYVEYPQYEPGPPVSCRDGDILESLIRDRHSEEVQQRLRERARSVLNQPGGVAHWRCLAATAAG